MIETHYTIKELSILLKLSRLTLWRWVREGKLPATRINNSIRVKQSDIENFLLENKKEIQENKILERHRSI